MKIKRFSLALILVLFTAIIGCSEEKQKQEGQVSIDSEEVLFKKASRAEIAKNIEDAVKIYQTIAEKYPDSEHRDKALFMIGYLKFENLGQKDEALKYFNELLEKYPDSDLVDDAEFMIKAIESGKDALTTFEETSGD